MSIYKGLSAVQEVDSSFTPMLKLKNGESAEIRILVPADEIISVWEYTFQAGGRWYTITQPPNREDDPLYKAGMKASFRSYIPVYNRTEERVQIFKASKTVGLQLLGLVQEYGDLTSRDFKILRQGEKLNTTYQFFPRDPSPFDFDSVEIPDIEKMVAPKSKEEILAILEGEVKELGDLEEGEDDFPF